MLPLTYYIFIGILILLHAAFKPSSAVTMFLSHAIFYIIYCFWDLPNLLEIVASFIFAVLMYKISLKVSVIYYVKMWIFHLFISITCLAFLPYLILNIDKDSINAIRLFWKKTLPVFGISVEVRNKENLPLNGPCVFISNHQSSLDMLTLVNVMPPKTTALAKKELKYAGPFGLAAWLSGLIFVDRSNHKSAIETMKYVSSIMKERKVNIWIFPEGTRNMNGSMLPFKKGAFHLAIEAQVPIVAVVMSSYSNFLDYDLPKFDTGHVIISCLPPFPTEGMKLDDLDDLMKRVHKEMSLAYNSSSSEINSNILNRE